MRVQIKIAVSLLLVLCIWCDGVRAQTPEVKTIRLAGLVEEDYDVQITKQILINAGYTVEFVQCPWPRCLINMKKGAVDVLSNVFVKPERKKFLLYTTEPIFNFKQFFYVRKDSKITFDGDYSKLKGYSIGLRHGFSYGRTFDKVLKSKLLKTERVSSSIQNIKMTVLKRRDLFVENPMNLIINLQQTKLLKYMKEVKLLKPPVSNQPSYITVSKKYPQRKELLLKLDKHLKEVKANGTQQRVLNKYFGDYELD